jgi:glycosyltransferase involved in cell wall biosynthesis
MKYCVIVPTYNNDKTLKHVLDEVLKVSRDVIVVNDGSTDSTAKILTEFSEIHCISYSKNVGKGHALLQGFREAILKGYDYAISIDSDSQHYPDDIPKLIAKLEEYPGKLIMGSRNMEQEGIPGASSFGNKFSNFWYWAETGIKLSDTQTGFRAYPLKEISKMRFFTKKFEFEIEIIVRLAWRYVKFEEVPVKVDYPENRVSHFRPFKDFFRISVLNTVLVILALLFFLPRLLIKNFSLKRIWEQLKAEFKKDLNHPVKLAAAVGLGLFFGILPIWGFQMLVAFAVASYFKLNRAIVLLVSNISIPPMIPLIVFVSFKFGALFVEEPVRFFTMEGITQESIYLQLKQYLIGSTILAFVIGVTGFLLTRILVNFKPKTKEA